MQNWLMARTWQAYEFRVQEALDRLTGGDFSYCPTEHRVRSISRYSPQKKAVAVPLLPRMVFCTVSYPRLESFDGIRGFDGLVCDDWGIPQVIPGWQMQEFMRLVDQLRVLSLKTLERSRKPIKQVKLRSFADAKAELQRRIKEYVDPETGEILSIQHVA